mgnify:CR=1 FL=1
MSAATSGGSEHHDKGVSIRGTAVNKIDEEVPFRSEFLKRVARDPYLPEEYT